MKYKELMDNKEMRNINKEEREREILVPLKAFLAGLTEEQIRQLNTDPESQESPDEFQTAYQQLLALYNDEEFALDIITETVGLAINSRRNPDMLKRAGIELIE